MRARMLAGDVLSAAVFSVPVLSVAVLSLAGGEAAYAQVRVEARPPIALVTELSGRGPQTQTDLGRAPRMLQSPNVDRFQVDADTLSLSAGDDSEMVFTSSS